MIRLNENTLEKAIIFRKKAKNIIEYRRASILIMMHRNYSAAEIGVVLGISRSAVYQQLKQFQKFGEEALSAKKRKGRSPKVYPEYITLLNQVYRNCPSKYGYSKKRWTLNLLRDHLASQTGLTVSIEHMRRLLNGIPKNRK